MFFGRDIGKAIDHLYENDSRRLRDIAEIDYKVKVYYDNLCSIINIQKETISDLVDMVNNLKAIIDVHKQRIDLLKDHINIINTKIERNNE